MRDLITGSPMLMAAWTVRIASRFSRSFSSNDLVRCSRFLHLSEQVLASRLPLRGA